MRIFQLPLLALAASVGAQSFGIILYDRPNYAGRTQPYNRQGNFRLPFGAER